MKPNQLMFSLYSALLGISAPALAQLPAAPPAPASSAAAAVHGPRAEFAGLTFDFGKVESGKLIQHDFIFTNVGVQALEIRDVRTSCGCTTAGAWDKRVEPGATGKIPLQFNSAGYGGPVLKTATVLCNDPARSNVVLQLSGTIWKPIDVNPGLAMFNFGPDVQTNQTRELRILSNLDEPVTLSEPTVGNPAFKAELKTLREGKEFELLVTVLPPLSLPTVSTPITLKTSAAKMPLLTVNAYATVQPMVTVVPAQLTLPPGRLASPAQYTLTVQNNSTNTLILSEPRINAEGAEARLREMQPGRLFALTVSFPAGFEVQSRDIAVTAQSSNPKFPLLKVPVFQVPPPANAAAQSPSPAVPAAATVAAMNPSKPLPAAGNAAGNIPGPKIQVPEPVFDFGRMESGRIVTNVFVVTNAGSGVLEISDVKSSCGCAAAANWTRSVAPGQTGMIPVIFDSGGLAGALTRSLWLISNDSSQPNVLLQFKATVWRPIDAIPAVAVFNFGPDVQTSETRVLRLVSNLEKPVTLSEPKCTNHSFRAELKTVVPGKEFELRVTVVPPLGPGSWSAPVTLETSSSAMPVVTVSAYAVVSPAFTVAPPRIMLPPAPLASPQQFSVTIRNQGTNALALSDPDLNAAGSRVQLREVQAGRLFELSLTFPEGFRSQPGETLEAKVKCNKAQSPLIRIPVVQLASPADPDTPAALAPAKTSPATGMSTAAAAR